MISVKVCQMVLPHAFGKMARGGLSCRGGTTRDASCGWRGGFRRTANICVEWAVGVRITVKPCQIMPSVTLLNSIFVRRDHVLVSIKIFNRDRAVSRQERKETQNDNENICREWHEMRPLRASRGECRQGRRGRGGRPCGFGGWKCGCDV